MYEIKIALTKWLKSASKLIRNTASSMLEMFDGYCNIIHGIIGVADFLDPRFKMKLLEWMFTQIYIDRVLYKIARIKNIYHELLNEFDRLTPNACSSCTFIFYC